VGIGVNSTLFSVINTVLLRPLPFEHPERVVILWEYKPEAGARSSGVSPAAVVEWRDQHGIFDRVSAYDLKGVTLAGSGDPENVRAGLVSASYFSLFGIYPSIGRTFREEEDRFGAEPVAIISNELWQRRFNSDEKIVGRNISINSVDTTIIGVMPSEFRSPLSTKLDLLIPISFRPSDYEDRGKRRLMAFGLLKPDLSLDAARSQLESWAINLEKQYPATNKGWRVKLKAMHTQVVGDIENEVLIAACSALLVLIITCVNVAGILLIQSESRRREIAIRFALGATRGRIVRQLLTESLLLSFIGGLGGLLLAQWSLALIRGIDPHVIPRLENIRLDLPVLGFASLASLLVGVICGLMPGLKLSKSNLTDAIKEGAKGATPGHRRYYAHNIILTMEIALAFIVLTGTLLMNRSFRNIKPVDPGFDERNKLTFKISLSAAKYDSGNKQKDFFQQLLERVAAYPMVKSASAITNLPYSGSYTVGILVRNDIAATLEKRMFCHYRAISSNYLQFMGIPLLKGRSFTDLDDDRAPNVAIVNETLSRQLGLPSVPIGEKIEIIDRDRSIQCVIVGVVGNIRFSSGGVEFKPEVYVPYLQNPSSFMSILVSPALSGSDPTTLTGVVKESVRGLDKEQPVDSLMTMSSVRDEAVAYQRFLTSLMTVFGCVALLLAAVGVFGVMSYIIADRTKEIGIRIALGARKEDVLWLVFRRGTIPVLVGIAIGLIGSYGLTRFMESLLYGISAMDMVSLIGSVVLILLSVVIACYLPIRKALSTNPTIVLRYE
jgi:putative ABC transport system permease protein